MLSEFTQWLVDLVKRILSAAWDLVTDLFINAFDLVVSAFAALVAAIPVPDWLSGGLGSAWSGMDGGVIWIATQCGVPMALGIVGAGYAFRFLRKVVTLFQW